MIIQVLGTGCTKCKTLYELANKAVAETGVALYLAARDEEAAPAIEIALGLVVFAVVGMLGTLHPAIHLVDH